MQYLGSSEILFDFAPIALPTAATKAPEILAASQDVLLQGLQLLFDIWDSTYARTAGAPYNASIGEHYRHVLEHFQSLAWGMRSGEINYDARPRNKRLETEVTFSSIATCDVLRAIKNYSQETLSSPCRVIQSVSCGPGSPDALESNIGRELAYCAGHALQHYANIRLICRDLGVSIPADFGEAPRPTKRRSI